jgi:integrase
LTTGQGWWTERYVGPYVETKAKRWASTTTTTASGILPRFPELFRAAGVTDPPSTPSAVTETHLRQLRESNLLSPNGLGLYLTLLRGLLKFYRAPLAEDAYLFRVQKVDLGRRRWAEPSQAAALWNAADERARVPIGLALLGGARRIEVMRLHVRDVDFTLPNPTMNLLGKGGKWRNVDLMPALYAVLRSWTSEKAPSDRVWPWSETEADRTLQEVAKASGAFPVNPKGYALVSWHDLRRTFIRQMLATHKVDLWDVAELVGHQSTNTTTHYAGLNRTKARGALLALEQQIGVGC